MVDLHRHDEFSLFDGFGRAVDLVEIAKELGHTALSVTNHGNTNGLVKHYQACKKYDMNCIMGVEAYFQPIIDKEKPRFHLCLFVKNLQGYENLNKLMFRGEQQKYYNPVITFADLEEFKEGLVCSSACIQGFPSYLVRNGKTKLAKKALQRFKAIFGKDFYVEIMPYKIDDDLTQEYVNVKLMKLAEELNIKCILTSDSHYGSKDDWETYLKMHEIGRHDYDIEQTYGERYMPSERQIAKRFIDMHAKNFGLTEAKTMASGMIRNVEEIEAKVEQNILDQLELRLPEVGGSSKEAYAELVRQVKAGLKRIGKHKDKEYVERCKDELRVIKMHDFSGYFLLVADYVKWARKQGIQVGPGRGSVCNCEIAYLLGITEVDSIRFGLDFKRFLRDDKIKLPDIDIDFETGRRQEVIDYLINKYDGHAAQIVSYGLYQVDNLVNDLAKVCGLEDAGEKKELKDYLARKVDEAHNFNYCPNDLFVRRFNKRYDNIVLHFSKMYNQIRFIGTHAAGVAITGDNILKYSAIKLSKGKSSGETRKYTVYDLADLDTISVMKFDMLGLKTMESLGELRKMTGNVALVESAYDDPKIWEQFAAGNTEGIFQFEKPTPKQILKDMKCDCFEDATAASAMNRPGPLSMNMPAQYVHNKFNLKDAKRYPFYEFTKETYGTIVYQEQVQKICVKAGNMSWEEADRVMKLMKNAIASMGEIEKINKDKKELTKKFVSGAILNGYDEKVARNMFENILVYTFNKGHAVGYNMISLEEMYYKVYYPAEFWCVKIKHAQKNDRFKHILEAVKAGIIIFLPHVNYTADDSLRVVDNEKVIQEGLCSHKGIGLKTALVVENERKANGPYKTLDDFKERMVGKGIGPKTIDFLAEQGALEFNKKRYINRVVKYNSSLLGRC
jgi:DNA polymerase-3 subunit alpha